MQTSARRFQDNTTIKPVDRRRVYGFAPGHRMSMSPRSSNLQEQTIPQGQLILFKPRVDGYLKDRMVKVPGPNGSPVLGYDGSEEYSGLHFAQAVASKFQTGKDDFGFRILECLTDLEYDRNTGWDAADGYFAVLYPQIECEMGLEKSNPRGAANDVINNDQPLPCPTCRLKWLRSSAADEAIANSGLDADRLYALKRTLIDSFEAGLRYARWSLDKVTQQIEAKNSAKVYQDSDFHLMKMLHEKPKHVQQAEIQAEAARVQGEAIGKSVAEAIQAQAAQTEAERIKAENEELRRKLAELEKEPKVKK